MSRPIGPRPLPAAASPVARLVDAVTDRVAAALWQAYWAVSAARARHRRRVLRRLGLEPALPRWAPGAWADEAPADAAGDAAGDAAVDAAPEGPVQRDDLFPVTEEPRA